MGSNTQPLFPRMFNYNFNFFLYICSMSDKTEIWGEIPIYKNYNISSYGRVQNIVTGRILRLQVRKDGYIRIGLCSDSLQKIFRVHRLVGLVFISNPDNKPQINHKDFDKANNRVENLEWVTDEENKAHYGKSTSKPVRCVCECGNHIKDYSSINEASRITGIHYNAIGSNLYGKTVRCGGYRWKFI